MLRRMIGTFLALQAAMIGVAWACSCDQPGTAQELLDEHDAAFVGRAVKTRGGCQGFVHSSAHEVTTVFEVEEGFKGVEAGERVEVVHAEDGASCGVEYADDAAYLVLAWTDEGELHTGLCEGGGAVDETRARIDELREVTGG